MWIARRRGGRAIVLAAAAAAAVLLSGCPLPFEFNARGAGSSNTVDPSSPRMTEPVTISYAVQGGAAGTVASGGSYTAGDTTTVTLSTATGNAIIYYTDDGSAITNVNTVKKISASSGSFTITRTTSLRSTTWHAVAIGPNMVPSPEVSATVVVSPYPIVTVVSSASSISENGGTATFTLQASVAPASPITVSLQASGNYTPTDFTGTIPSSVVLPANQTSVVIAAITAVPDVQNQDDTVTVTALADTASPPTYSLGSPSAASVLIRDNGFPALTLSADRTMMNNTQTATFTVTASVPTVSGLVVNLSGSGFTAGSVNVPASVTLPAGATSATFAVTAGTQVPYPAQSSTISIAPGSGYMLGTPAACGLLITDVTYVFSGKWDFTAGLGSGVAGAQAWSISGGVTLSGGSLDFPGNYGTDVASNDVSAVITQDLFTVGVGFQLSSFSGGFGRAILAAGAGYRWFILRADPTGELFVDLNNHQVAIDLGFRITTGTDHSVFVAVDRVALTITAEVDGVRSAALPIPAPFTTWNTTSPSEMVFYNSDYSTGCTFAGLWHWVSLATGGLP